MRRQGQGELVPFDPEPERTTNRLRREQREAQVEITMDHFIELTNELALLIKQLRMRKMAN